ncbi:histidine kinase [Streptomyces sp. GLT-R25]
MVARQARLLERGRIARDMHDSLGHQLALIAVHAGALQVDPDLTDRQREGVRILRDASVTAMGELREAVGILHEDREDHRNWPDVRTTEPGHTEPRHAERTERIERTESAEAADTDGGRPGSRAVAAIDGLVESSRAAGAAVELLRSGAFRQLAPAAGHTAYRIAQGGADQRPQARPGRLDNPRPALRTGQPGGGGRQRARAGRGTGRPGRDQRRPGAQGPSGAGPAHRRHGAHRPHRGRRLPYRGHAALQRGPGRRRRQRHRKRRTPAPPPPRRDLRRPVQRLCGAARQRRRGQQWSGHQPVRSARGVRRHHEQEEERRHRLRRHRRRPRRGPLSPWESGG